MWALHLVEEPVETKGALSGSRVQREGLSEAPGGYHAQGEGPMGAWVPLSGPTDEGGGPEWCSTSDLLVNLQRIFFIVLTTEYNYV